MWRSFRYRRTNEKLTRLAKLFRLTMPPLAQWPVWLAVVSFASFLLLPMILSNEESFYKMKTIREMHYPNQFTLVYCGA
jgi:hypothetical protein